MDELGRQGPGFLTQEKDMFFRPHAAENATGSYFFGCADLAKAVALDVVTGDEDWFVNAAGKAGVRMAHFIDTHVDADQTRVALRWHGGLPHRIICTRATRAESLSSFRQ
jgi:hypothetical protein